jgi:Zn-dependent protease
MGVALGRFRGTEVRVHWTWVPVLAIIVVFFGSDLTTSSTAWSTQAAWVTAVIIALLTFLSVTGHELAHVVAASRSGMSAPAVVIQLLGGPYVMTLHPRRPDQELRVAAAGPIFSLAVAAVFMVITGFLTFGPIDVNSSPDGIQSLWFIGAVLAVFNLFIGLINLVPGYPLDGARMLHAVAWRRTGVETSATHAAVRVGRYVGFAFILFGAGLFVIDFFTGLLLVFSGWLITGSSRVLDQRAFLQTLVTGVHVGDALDPNPDRIPPQLTLDVFAGPYLGERLGAAAFVARGTDLLGLVGTAQIRRIPKRNWAGTRTEDAMVPIASIPVTSADADLWTELEALEQSGLDAFLVPTDEDGPSLLSRRSAALFVRDKAVEERRRLAATGGRPGRGGFFGRK